jgi:hypothetical protein
MNDKVYKYFESQSFLYCGIFLLFSAILITSYFYHADPNPKISVCMFYNLTKLPCPGCGLTRSFCAIAKGHITESFSFHIFGPLLFASVIFGWAFSLLALCKIEKPFLLCQSLVTNDSFIKIAGCIALIYWLIRLFVTCRSFS